MGSRIWEILPVEIKQLESLKKQELKIGILKISLDVSAKYTCSI